MGLGRATALSAMLFGLAFAGSIGFESLDDGAVWKIWNTQYDYYFNATSGIQFTNHYDRYWTHNVFCAGWKTSGENESIFQDDFESWSTTDDCNYSSGWDSCYAGSGMIRGITGSLAYDGTSLRITDSAGDNVLMKCGDLTEYDQAWVSFLGRRWGLDSGEYCRMNIRPSGGNWTTLFDSGNGTDTQYHQQILGVTPYISNDTCVLIYSNADGVDEGCGIDDFNVTGYLQDWKYDCNDALPFEWSHSTDNLTYVNITGYRDREINGRQVRLGLRYHLGLDDINMTVIPYVKNLGSNDIPNDIGFAWHVNDIQIGTHEENDTIVVNDTVYWLNESLNVNFTNLAETYYTIKDAWTHQWLRLDWNPGLTYRVVLNSTPYQNNTPVRLEVKTSGLPAGDEKFFKLTWIDAANLWCGVGSSGTCPTQTSPCSGLTCSYATCDCFVNASQTLDDNVTYYFKSMTVDSGVTLTIDYYVNGGTITEGGDGLGEAGGAGGNNTADGGFNAGGGAGGVGTSNNGYDGGNYSGGGGHGGLGAVGGAGGNGGGKIVFSARETINISGTITAPAGNGVDGTYNSKTIGASGGGGGGGGGLIYLLSENISITGSVSASGGGGGDGGDGGLLGGGGGAGGGGGFLKISAENLENSATLQFNGGTGGTGYGFGPNGAPGEAGGYDWVLVKQIDPANDSSYPAGDVTFRFNATSKEDSMLSCNITMNGTVIYENSSVVSAVVTVHAESITGEGIKYWNVTCKDSYAETISSTRNFTVAGTDTEPPTYSSNSTNLTVAGAVTKYSLLWNDDASLSKAVLSFDNCTGTLENISTVDLTTDEDWSDFVVTANYTVGCTIQWCVYANDSTGNLNTSCGDPFSYVTAEDYPASYSGNSTNYTLAGWFVNHRLRWDDEVGLSGYIFSFDNCTGTLVNDSWVQFNVTPNWSNVTKYINETEGCTIQWCVYANDSRNQWNTSCGSPFTYQTVVVTTWLNYSWYSVSPVSPSSCPAGSPCDIEPGGFFAINTTVQCVTNPPGFFCDNVSAALMYNGSSGYETIDWSIGSSPMWTRAPAILSFGDYYGFFDVTSQDSAPTGATFNGTYFWVAGDATDKVYRYLENGTYDNWNFSVTEDTSLQAVFFNNTYFWIVGDDDNRVYRYLADGSYDNWYFNVSSQDTYPTGVFFNGTYFWVTGDLNNRVYRYLANGSYDNWYFNVSSQDVTPTGVYYNGTHFMVSGDTGNKMYLYKSDGTYANRYINVANQDTIVKDVTGNGTYIWVVGGSQDRLYKYGGIDYWPNPSPVGNMEDGESLSANFTVYLTESPVEYYEIIYNFTTTSPEYSQNETNPAYIELSQNKPPKWYEHWITTPLPGTTVYHNLNWADGSGLAGYIFSFDNGTGNMVNGSWASLAGYSDTSTVGECVNETEGTVIQWCFYANDTYGLWNSSCNPSFNYTVGYGPNLQCDMEYSSGTCPNSVYHCVGYNCTYPTCDCVVTSSQSVANNVTYNFRSFILQSGRIITVSTNSDAAGGAGASNPDDGLNGTSQAGGNGGDDSSTGTGGHSAGGGGGGNSDGGNGGGYGGGGGGGSGSLGSDGGDGGGDLSIRAEDYIQIQGTIRAKGEDGDGVGDVGDSGPGGGGGGGGGDIYLVSVNVTVSGTLNTNGGKAGMGGCEAVGQGYYVCGNGGGGGGGGFIRISATNLNVSGALNVNGGAGAVEGLIPPGSGYSPSGSIGVKDWVLVKQVSPFNASVFSPGNVTFQFNATSNVNSTLSCNVTLNGTVVYQNSSVVSGIITSHEENITLGTHHWNVTCEDFYIPTTSQTKQLSGESDSASPTYSLNSTNSTLAGQYVEHRLKWDDDSTLAGYIFSFDNCTGALVNDSWTPFSGADWSNVTKYINETEGCKIQWCVYANDSYGNLNGSCASPFNYTTQVSRVLLVSWTAGSEVNPASCPSGSPCSYGQNQSFEVNATVECHTSLPGYDCGEVSGGIMYNVTLSGYDYIDTTAGSIPFLARGPIGQEVGEYDNWNFSVGTQESEPDGVTTNGTHFWVTGANSDRVHRYRPDGTYDNWYFDVSPQEEFPYDLFYDGTYFWVVGATRKEVLRYWPNGTYSGWNFSVSTQVPMPCGIEYNDTYFWLVDYNEDVIHRYLANGTYDNWNFSGQDGTTQDVTYDGTYFWVLGSIGDSVLRYWPNGTYSGWSFSVGGQDGEMWGMEHDGIHFWIVGSDSDMVYRYSGITSYSNPAILATLSDGQKFQLNFTVNATGSPVEGYELVFNFTSDRSDTRYNETNPAYVTISDSTAPLYSLNSTNSTLAGQYVEHRLQWQDASGLSGYTFSFDNCTGTLVNDSWLPFSGIEWSNVTKAINYTLGCTIRWCVWANDSFGNWNGTSCASPFSYQTTGSEYVSITFTSSLQSGIEFGSTDPGSGNASSTNCMSRACNVTVSGDTTLNVDIVLRAGSYLTRWGGAETLEEQYWNATNTSQPTGPLNKVHTTYDYTNKVGTSIQPDDSVSFNSWLSIPAAQIAGLYNNTIYFCATETGTTDC